MYSLTIICCVIAVAAYGQSLKMGKCKEPSTSLVLDINKFAGTWYEIERSSNIIGLSGNCPSSDWTLITDTEMRVFHHDTSRITDRESGYIGTATVNGTELNIKYHKLIVGDTTKKIRVLDTDYDTYAVLWYCNNYGFMHSAKAWTYARRNFVNEDFSASTQAAFQNAGVKKMKMHRVDRTGCV